jgi:hypothetical protein
MEKTINSQKRSFAVIENEVSHKILYFVFFFNLLFSYLLSTRLFPLSASTLITNSVASEILEHKKVLLLFLFFHV